MSVSEMVPEAGDVMGRLSGALDGAPPIVAFANDWRTDPTSKHHIMRIYGEHTPVLWVESSGMRRPQLSNTMDLHRIMGRLKKAAGGLTREHEKFHVLSPLSIPLPASAWARRANRTIYQQLLLRTIRKLGFRQPPLLWVYIPTVATYLEGIPRSGLVYHCVDRWWAFSEYDPDVMRASHEKLCREADVVFASSQELLEDCLQFTPRAHLIRHGVEWEHFAKAALEELPRPADIADIEGPILGFFGLIHDWVDQDVIVALADAFPEATVVLIGKVQQGVDASKLSSRPNIRLVGQKPYAELPAYAAAFDVALIPFVDNELTVAVNPIKLREYLSAGLPVVATALPEIELFSGNPMLRTAHGAEGFVEGVRHFLAAPLDREGRRAAALAMASESWVGRCATMLELLAAERA